VDVTVSASYEIDQDVLVLRLAAAEDLEHVAEIVQAASRDAGFRSPMRLLLDLRGAVRGLNYEDMRLQIENLAGMGAVLAPIWALLTTGNAYGMSAAQMFAVLARIENVNVRVFDNEAGALSWLQLWAD
jgi:pyruvate/2-oxoacid:ferredoxin oxidoreductase beta subunit